MIFISRLKKFKLIIDWKQKHLIVMKSIYNQEQFTRMNILGFFLKRSGSRGACWTSLRLHNTVLGLPATKTGRRSKCPHVLIGKEMEYNWFLTIRLRNTKMLNWKAVRLGCCLQNTKRNSFLTWGYFQKFMENETKRWGLGAKNNWNS